MAKITVYIKDNCQECAKALDVVSWIKSLAPDVEIRLIDMKSEEAPQFVKGADGPVYEVAGFYLKGNPNPEQLRQILELIAISSVN
jgi:arsenate reductase-like glutaredoxin family protein